MPLCEVHYFSEVLKKHTSANVILPSPKLVGPYHVMFLLHGLSDDESIWMRRTSIERYVEEVPLIVVMPDGGRSFYVDALQGYPYGTALGVELPALIRQWFPTKDPWCIGGLSMGGYGAFRLAMTYPETFVSAVSHSGALVFGHYDWSAANEEFQKEFLPILGESPRGGPNDLFALVAGSVPMPALRFDCGVADFLLAANRHYHEFLTENEIPHEYAEFDGDHNWAYWDEHVQEGLVFHRRNLGF